jgi:hypothetical protein
MDKTKWHKKRSCQINPNDIQEFLVKNPKLVRRRGQEQREMTPGRNLIYSLPYKMLKI